LYTSPAAGLELCISATPTASIAVRFKHKHGAIEGFSSEYHCARLVYYETYDDVHKAIGREKQMKGWTRAKKIALIEARNPRWEGLAEKWGAQMLFAGESMKDKR
jgi:putative endonuclease